MSSRETERGLGEVVRAEGEEIGRRGDLVRGEARARQLHHRAHRPPEAFRDLLLRDPLHQLPHQVELALVGDQGDHDLHVGRLAARSRTATAARKIARTCIS